MKKSAFTLIETLVAMMIAVSMLAIIVAANRVASNTAVSVQNATTMNMLANESIANIQLLKDSGEFDTNFGGISAPTTNIYSGLLTVSNQNNGCQAGNCPTVENGGPVYLQWCPLPSSLPCANTSAAVANDSGTTSRSAVYTKTQGEIVGVRKVDTSGAAIINYDIADATNPVSAVQLNAADTNIQKDWSFYVRKISVTRYGQNDSLDFSQLPSSASQPDLRENTYRVSVTVRALSGSSAVAKKSIILTNWK